MAEWLEPCPLSARSVGSRGCEFKARPNVVNFAVLYYLFIYISNSSVSSRLYRKLHSLVFCRNAQ